MIIRTLIIFFLLLNSCKENENCISNIKIERQYNNPSPDRIILNCNAPLELIESFKNEKEIKIEVYLTEIEKLSVYSNSIKLINDKEIELEVFSSYFLMNPNEKIEDIEKNLRKSSDLKVTFIMENKEYFITNCD